MTDEPIAPNEHTDEEPAYCTLCGDPVSGADLFCAGCADSEGEVHGHSEEG